MVVGLFLFHTFGSNFKQAAPEDCNTSAEGICFVLKLKNLQPRGKFLSQVT
jgi:hypothetical protein